MTWTTHRARQHSLKHNPPLIISLVGWKDEKFWWEQAKTWDGRQGWGGSRNGVGEPGQDCK